MITLQIVVTEKCNLSCHYCYVKNENVFLDKETFLNFYNGLSPSEEYKIDFFGGEPLLNFDMVRFITETVSTDNRFKKLYLPSNGMTLTQEMVDFIKKHNIEFSWSGNGITPDNIGTYKKSIEFIRQVTNKAGILITPVNTDFIGYYEFFLNEFGMCVDFDVIRDGWDEHASDMFVRNYEEFINYIIRKFKDDRAPIPNNILKCISIIYHSMRFGDHMIRCFDSNRVCLSTDGSTSFCYRLHCDGEYDSPDPKELYDTCIGCEIYNYCNKGCYGVVRKVGIDGNLCKIYKTLFYEAVRLNHELRSDIVWVKRHIGRIFYDTKRSI